MSKLNLNAMKIDELKAALTAGHSTVAEVFAIVDARVQRRIKSGEPQYPKVNEYRNELADVLSAATGQQIPHVAIPTYKAKVQPNSALPTDPEQLADVVFATVGATNVAAVISRLTARIVGASQPIATI